VLGAALLAFAPIGSTNGQSPAVETFQKLQQNLVRDKAQRNWNACLRDAEELKSFLNGSPRARLEVARAQLQLGHRAQALTETNRFLAMGQTNDILKSSLFEPLRTVIEKQVTNNQSAISRAAPALQVADPELLPEDIDYDPTSKRFFVTSILKFKVVVLNETGSLQNFAASPDRWPMVALKVDSRRRRLWATEVALDGFNSVAAADWGRSVLLEYDLDRGTLLSRHDGPTHSNLGDMVLAPNGDPIVSDGAGGGIYRLRGNELRRIDHGDFISPQTIAICADGRHAFVPDYVRGLAAFDIETGAARWLSTKNAYSLHGIDGLYCHEGSLMAIQNGASPERVVSFVLDPSRAAVVAERVVEQATSTLGDPTHGVFVDKTFFYIANSGWDVLDEHGAVKSSAHLTPALLMGVAGS
jgi:hypothetical protein